MRISPRATLKASALPRKMLKYSLPMLLLFAAWVIFWYHETQRIAVLILSLVAVAPLLVLLIKSLGIQMEGRRKISFLAGVLLYFCMLFAFLLPPFAVPDEFHHYLSSYWLTNCVLGESSPETPETIVMREDDWNLYSGFGLRKEMENYHTFSVRGESYQEISDHFSLFKQSERLVEVPEELMFSFSFGNENGFAKVGSVVGMLIGRLLGLGAYPVFYLGRMFSALLFVALVTAAVCIAPIGKGIFIAIAFFPITLSLAGSYSYDGSTIGYSFLFLAALLRALFSPEKVGRKTIALLTVSAALLSPCKAIYFLEVGLVLFVPRDRFESHRAAALSKLMVAGCAMAAVLAFKFSMVATVAGGSPLSTQEGTATNSLFGLAIDPLRTVALLFRTVDSNIDFYWTTAIGSNLGWIQPDLSMPAAYMMLYVFALIYSAQQSETDCLRLAVGWRILFSSVFVAVSLAVLFSMATAWTSTAAETIGGVQGRYFLPALPLLLLAARSENIHIANDSIGRTLFVLLTLNALYVTRFIALALM